MQELRILSGYHRGATLPLDGETLDIGADDDADVVLADPGIAAHHAQLSNEDGVWLLTPQDGPVRGQDSNAAQEEVELQDGAFGRAGAIWLAICETGAPWQDPPPQPADAMTDVPAQAAATESDDDMMDDVEDGDGIEAGDVMDDVQADALAQHADRADATDEAHDAAENHNGAQSFAAEASGASAHVAAPRRHSRGFRMVLIPVTAVAVLSAAAAYALTAYPAAPGEEIAAREAAEVRRLDALPRALPQDQLQAALRKRLTEIDLLSRVNVDLNDREWTISGALNEDDADRLQRMLRGFSQRYVIDFPVNVRIGSAESMLPFRISQVISGNDPSIVTDDGRRLYVGDEYRGMRLAAVAGNQLKFTGKQNLNIVW